MNKTAITDFRHASSLDATPKPFAPDVASAHPQSLLDLPAGEARQSLLAVHGILSARFAAQPRLAIYEAGGGSTSFLPLNLMKSTLAPPNDTSVTFSCTV